MGIPHRIVGEHRFFDRKEIKDMMCYMRLVSNPADDVSLRRIINEPKRGIGDKSLDLIEKTAKNNGWSLMDSIASDAVQDELSAKARAAIKKRLFYKAFFTQYGFDGYML